MKKQNKIKYAFVLVDTYISEDNPNGETNIQCFDTFDKALEVFNKTVKDCQEDFGDDCIEEPTVEVDNDDGNAYVEFVADEDRKFVYIVKKELQ